MAYSCWQFVTQAADAWLRSAAHRHLESGHPRGKVVLSMKHGAEE